MSLGGENNHVSYIISEWNIKCRYFHLPTEIVINIKIHRKCKENIGIPKIRQKKPKKKLSKRRNNYGKQQKDKKLTTDKRVTKVIKFIEETPPKRKKW